MSANPYVTWDMVEKYSELPWDWNELSKKRIDWNIVDKFSDKPWNWNELSKCSSPQRFVSLKFDIYNWGQIRHIRRWSSIICCCAPFFNIMCKVWGQVRLKKGRKIHFF